MPREPRNNMKTSYFHVMTQGINKEYIFDKEMDIKYYIKIMYKQREEYNIKIISYCIMNNHAHILLSTGNVSNLSKYMQKLNTKYAIYYNKKYNRVGYVFRDRYKSEGIYDEKHMHSCISYIYNNPVKAKICIRAEDYSYSNIREYKGKIEDENLYTFLEIKQEDYKDIIKKYLEENKLKKEELLKNKEMLKKIVKMLREKTKISFRKMEEELEISRETLRKIIE